MIGPICAVATPPAALALRLTGVPVEVVGATESVDEALRRATGMHGAALLCVEEALLDRLPEESRRRWERQRAPVLVGFPGPAWAARPPAEAAVVELIRRAIGYRVRLG